MGVAVITAVTPESNDSAAAVRRYQAGYHTAEAVITFAQTVTLGGICAGGFVFTAGLVEFILNPAEHQGFALIFASFIACAVLLILMSQILGMGMRSQGQLLKAALDFDVNSSPFLSNAQRGRAMSLRVRPPVPKVLPVWTE